MKTTIKVEKKMRYSEITRIRGGKHDSRPNRQRTRAGANRQAIKDAS